jgi:serine/threonine protein phosphatase PrpC
VLRGRDHVAIGEIGVVAEGVAAAAISRGGAPKTYRYRDPNEDAAAFATGEAGCVIAVADAHLGCEASELAVAALLEGCARDWTGAPTAPADWPELARAAVAQAHDAVAQSAARSGRFHGRTTLAFALVCPGDDLLAWASIGDSHLFQVNAAGATELAPGSESPTYFVGASERTAEELMPRVRTGTAPLGATRVVMAVTDGLSEKQIGVVDPAAAVRDAVREAEGAAAALRPPAAARGLLELAFAAHRGNRAGDNVAAALVWLEPPAAR